MLCPQEPQYFVHIGWELHQLLARSLLLKKKALQLIEMSAAGDLILFTWLAILSTM